MYIKTDRLYLFFIPDLQKAECRSKEGTPAWNCRINKRPCKRDAVDGVRRSQEAAGGLTYEKRALAVARRLTLLGGLCLRIWDRLALNSDEKP